MVVDRRLRIATSTGRPRSCWHCREDLTTLRGITVLPDVDWRTHFSAKTRRMERVARRSWK